jgi:hypothetical protein
MRGSFSSIEWDAKTCQRGVKEKQKGNTHCQTRAVSAKSEVRDRKPKSTRGCATRRVELHAGAAKCGTSHPEMPRIAFLVCRNGTLLEALREGRRTGSSWARILQRKRMQETTQRQHELRRPLWGLRFRPLTISEVRNQEEKTTVSRTEARGSTRTAGADCQYDWLELLAPDRRPRVQLSGDAAAERQPRLPHQLKNELVRLLSVR